MLMAAIGAGLIGLYLFSFFIDDFFPDPAVPREKWAHCPVAGAFN